MSKSEPVIWDEPLTTPPINSAEIVSPLRIILTSDVSETAKFVWDEISIVSAVISPAASPVVSVVISPVASTVVSPLAWPPTVNGSSELDELTTEFSVLVQWILTWLNVFSIKKYQLEEIITKAANYSRYRPSIFYKDMSHERFAQIQSDLYHFSGIYHVSKPTRYYPFKSLSHALGYVAEVSYNDISSDTTNYYRQRDLIGKSGIEKNFEKDLRGNKGVRLKIYDVRGNESGSFKGGEDDIIVENGSEIKLSIDIKLQRYIEKLLEGKTGSVVAIDPSSGELLAIASAPSFDPNILSGRDYSKNYRNLQLDTLKPIYNRALTATEVRHNFQTDAGKFDILIEGTS